MCEKCAKIGEKASRGNDRKQAYRSNGSWDAFVQPAGDNRSCWKRDPAG